MTEKDQPANDYMARALELARKAVGSVSPNPAVGAVIVKDGGIVGEGHTRPPGQFHAEVVALQQAGEAARGAELFVTLEPCAIQGRTPPCTNAIIDAGVARVHIAALDPNPSMDGRGIEALEAGGVSVTVRDGSIEARQIIEAFTKHVTTGMPFIVAKFAVSLDGKIATRSGDSRWISSEASRHFTHALRAEADAIMVGIGTALADDPQLTVRDVPFSGRQPVRIVLDSNGRLPPDAAVLHEAGETLVVTADAPETARQVLTAAGAEVLSIPGPDGHVDVEALLRMLGQRDITSVLVEGGSTLLGALFDSHLVDKVVAVVAPVVIGGTEAPTAVGGRGAQTLPDAMRLEHVQYQQIDDDMIVIGYPAR